MKTACRDQMTWGSRIQPKRDPENSGSLYTILSSFLYTYDCCAEAFAAIPYSMTAPLQDAETLRWYLASQPVVAFGGGAT